MDLTVTRTPTKETPLNLLDFTGEESCVVLFLCLVSQWDPGTGSRQERTSQTRLFFQFHDSTRKTQQSREILIKVGRYSTNPYIPEIRRII